MDVYKDWMAIHDEDEAVGAREFEVIKMVDGMKGFLNIGWERLDKGRQDGVWRNKFDEARAKGQNIPLQPHIKIHNG